MTREYPYKNSGTVATPPLIGASIGHIEWKTSDTVAAPPLLRLSTGECCIEGAIHTRLVQDSRRTTRVLPDQLKVAFRLS